ncbi:MAG TPA: cell division protein ZapE [Woeseiaceae bacterium]|nr:cell division protein ZapE [Woeseiaceae bacterium]
MSISSAYAELCRRDGLVHDAAQLKVIDVLQQLQDRLVRDQSFARRLRRRLPAIGARSGTETGVYLWGGVGRGKTLLMDLFHNSLDISRKRRIHFHRMMSDIHAELRALSAVEDPLEVVASGIARDTSVLCFDEFFVSDIGDAMILGRLLEGLFRRGVTLVATSNSAPRDLYPNGLQRERFLPAIALIEKHTRVIHIDDGADYRLRLLQRAGTYLTCGKAEADARLEQFFHDSATGAVPDDSVLDILGRPIQTRRHATDVAWFDFQALCEGPRSTEDYIEIARRFQTVILSGVPVLTAAKDDAARRFVALVDEFYDRRVKLIVCAAAPIERLYQGERLAFEFRRTSSRLNEMQSTSYLHLEHRA